MDEQQHADDASASSALARLQAADPAGPDPDLTALRARILAARDDDVAVDDAAAVDDAVVVPMRRRPWLLPAAAGIAAIALAGAALSGYSVGRGDATIVASPPIAASAADAAAPASGAMAGDAMASDTTAPNAPAPEAMTLAPASGAAAKTMLATPTVWIAAGSLPDAPSVGTGYRVARDGIDPTALADTLAQGLGVNGNAIADGGGWRVGGDGGGPALVVSDDALLSWSFTDPTPVEGSKPLGVDRATALARDLLRGIGVPVDDVEWQVMQADATTTVTAWHTLGGVRTQLAWTVTLGPDGRILGASGFAAALQPVPGYELVGAATAVDRIGRPGWLALAPTALTAGTAPAPVEATPPGPSPLMNGRPTLTVPVASITVTGSSIGLSPYTEPGGSMLVLPSYVLSDASGATWSLLAVADRYVRFAEPAAGTDLAAR